jgi:hypothetical protein
MIQEATEHDVAPVREQVCTSDGLFRHPENMSSEQNTENRKNIFFIGIIKKINILSICITKYFPREKVRRYAPERQDGIFPRVFVYQSYRA